MRYPEIIDYEFSNYLNRNIIGILKLNSIIKKITVKYELAKSFSNLSCRFIIDVDLNIEFQSANKEQRNIANKYLHNSSNSTGSKFVSFIYQSQNSHHIDFNKIKDFIIHYEFAKAIFNGVLRENIVSKEKIDISSIENEPLFNYSMKYLNKIKYKEEDLNNNTSYKSLMGRSFQFDIFNHQMILKASSNFDSYRNTISDIEICKKTQSNNEDIRRLVLDNNIPFKIRHPYLEIISEMEIDRSELKNFINNYTPSSTFEKVDKKRILLLIDKIERSENESKRKLNKLIKSTGIELNDIVLVKKENWNSISEEIGAIKEFKLSYDNSLEIIYNKIKNNLEESKLPNVSTKIENVLYFLKQKDKIKLNDFKSKNSQIRALKKLGKKHL